MRLRQVPRHEVQGHDLRPLRRQGDAQPRAPQAHGPHRAGRAGRAHLVLQGHAQPLGQPAGDEDHEPGKGHLLPGLRGHQSGRHRAQEAATADRRRISLGPRTVRRRHLRGRHGRRGRAQAAAGPRPGAALQGPARRPGRNRLEAKGQGPDQPAEDRREHPRLGQQARVDGAGRDSGHSARSAAAGAAGLGQLRHQRPERSVSPHHQPQQPAEEAGRPERAGSHHPQRKADAAAVGRRAVRQQPLQAPRARLEQSPAQVADRHDQGQAGPLPRKPAGQARRLLGPQRDRRRSQPAAAPVRPAQEDRAGTVPAVHHSPAEGPGPRRHDQERQEDARAQGRGGVGYPGRGDPQSPGAAESCSDAAPHGHPGLRADAGRRQRHQAAPAGVQGLQRRLRRRPDGRAPAAVDRGPGRSPHADDVDQQHLQPVERRADHQPVAGRGDGLLLRDDVAARPARAKA